MVKFRAVNIREVIEKKTMAPDDLLGPDLCPSCGGHYKASVDGATCRTCQIKTRPQAT